MTIGFRIRDANTGDIVVDLTDRIVRFTYTGQTTANVAGSVTIPDYADGTPFYVIPSVVGSLTTRNAPSFTLNQSTGVLSWTAAPYSVQIYAGVY